MAVKNKFKTVGKWNAEQWRQAWEEIASLCAGIEDDDRRMNRIQSYLELFDQEYLYKDCDWFFYALTRFRNIHQV